MSRDEGRKTDTGLQRCTGVREPVWPSGKALGW